MPRPRLAVSVTAVVVDALLVLLFAGLGRRSHAETVDLAGVWGTAFPFLLALGLAWLLLRVARRPLAPVRSGVGLWAITVVLGLALRAWMGGGVVLAFALVAAGTLAAFLIGWRVVAAGVRALRARRRPV